MQFALTPLFLPSSVQILKLICMMLRFDCVNFHGSILKTAGRKRLEHTLLSKLPYVHKHINTFR